MRQGWPPDPILPLLVEPPLLYGVPGMKSRRSPGPVQTPGLSGKPTWQRGKNPL